MNPFKFGTIVDGIFFTDRISETALLEQKLDSENHIILISPRRFGKSSLVQKVTSQTARHCINLDLQYVMSIDDFAAQLLKAVFKIFPIEKLRHLMKHFRVVPTISTNAITGVVEISFQPTSNATILLEDAMSLIDKITSSTNRLIIVLDEFQEVIKIGKGFDKILRSIMQKQKNLNYILLGSQESMMEAIFEKKSSPFYHFGQIIRLTKIPHVDFLNYITSRMPEGFEFVANEILDFTLCHPYYTQQLSAQVWDNIKYRDIKDKIVETSIKMLVAMHDLDYERLWQNLNRTDRLTLRLLAEAKLPLQNRSKAVSTTYSSLLRLMKSGYVVKVEQYEIEDPFFKRWILQNIN
ncbi:MAG: ATP-binding protein [Bacteroidales bacterium]|nr:ATP-binding protein [Bacteroidales bacterium]